MLKRRDSAEIGVQPKQFSMRKMKKKNMHSHRINVVNFSKFRMGEHYQLAQSIVIEKDPKPHMSNEMNSNLQKNSSKYRSCQSHEWMQIVLFCFVQTYFVQIYF